MIFLHTLIAVLCLWIFGSSYCMSWPRRSKQPSQPGANLAR